MAYAPMILAAVSTAVTVVAAVQQSRAASRAADYNRQVAEQNAEAARRQAAMRAQQVDRQNRLRLGMSRAAIGAAGITTEGSALDVLGDLVSQGELERQNVLYQGEMQARGFDIDRDLSRREGRDAGRAGMMAAGTALLAGGSQIQGQGVRLNLWGSGGGG